MDTDAIFSNAQNSEVKYAGEQGGDWKGGGEEEERDGEEQGEEQEHGHDCPIHSCFVTSAQLPVL